jgi:L-asparagine transporter-like permease
MANRVWGIVLIVFSVLVVLGSFINYRDVAASEDLITSLGGFVPGGKNIAAMAIRNEKAYSIAGFGLGLILAVIGTMLLSDVSPNRYIVRFEDDDLETDEADDGTSGKWKF